MKHARAFTLTAILAVFAALGAGAFAAGSKPITHIGAPGANIGGHSRSLGGDDSESDEGTALPGGRTAHGTIGNAPPSASAVARLRSIGGDD